MKLPSFDECITVLISRRYECLRSNRDLQHTVSRSDDRDQRNAARPSYASKNRLLEMQFTMHG
jgi:hypothetical protein